MKKSADEFELDPKLIYLNSGSHSICPRTVVEAQIRHLKEYEKNPTASLNKIWPRLWEIQKELGTFFQADPYDLFLRPNITAALNTFLLGVDIPDLKKGEEILTSDVEYGAIYNLCRFRTERDGMKLRTFTFPIHSTEVQTLTENSLTNLIVSALRPETRVLLLSHIVTGNGVRLPIAKIAKETRKRGIIFVVDGAHGPGSQSLSMAELEDVDFYGGNIHKWMMGPKGTSFGWVPKRMQNRVHATQAGWTTYDSPARFSTFGEGHPFQGLMQPAACIDFSPYLAIHETLEFWKRHTPEWIWTRMEELLSYTESKMRKTLDLPLLTPLDPKLRGPLLSYGLPAHLAARGYDLVSSLLNDHGIQVMTAPLKNSFCLRLSPHIYNSEAEIDRAAEVLARCIK